MSGVCVCVERERERDKRKRVILSNNVSWATERCHRKHKTLYIFALHILAQSDSSLLALLQAETRA